MEEYLTHRVSGAVGLQPEEDGRPYKTQRQIDWNQFPVAEHVSVPEKRDPEGTRGNGAKTERLRVPLHE